jgi:hypothetical protein
LIQRVQQLSFASGVFRFSEGKTHSSGPGSPENPLHWEMIYGTGSRAAFSFTETNHCRRLV